MVIKILMKPESPFAVFEVLFEGEKLYPEQIPLRTLSDSFAAIQRLASGDHSDDDEERGSKPGEDSLRLVGVDRGAPASAIAGPVDRDAGRCRGG